MDTGNRQSCPCRTEAAAGRSKAQCCKLASMDNLFKKNKRALDSEVRQQYQIHWNIGLFGAPCAEPACTCPPSRP